MAVVLAAASAIAAVVGAGTGVAALKQQSKASKAEVAPRAETMIQQSAQRAEDVTQKIDEAPKMAADTAKEQAKALQKRRSRTILTSPLGTMQPETAKKTLLGE